MGERHRIIANDWQAAHLSTLVAHLLRRALDLLGQVDFRPEAVRADLAGWRIFPKYLYSAAELVDRAADLAAESTALIHDNERRWRIFRHTTEQLRDASSDGRQTDREHSSGELVARDVAYTQEDVRDVVDDLRIDR